MRLVSLGVCLAVLAGPSAAEDVVRLRRGGSLRGEIRSQSESEVVLVLASGEIRIPRTQIARIEADRTGEAEGVRVIQRDEWSLLVHGTRVAGWVRVLHWERGEFVHVEEHRVLFAHGDDPRRERRRVEIVNRRGEPREYLWMESGVGHMEVWSGQVDGGRHVRQHRLEGKVETTAAPWPEGASLPLPMWVHTLDHLGAATRTVLDPRTGEFDERRFERAAGRYFDSTWAGTILATTAARVEFARRIHARADPAALAADAKLHPLTPRNPERLVHHVAAGVTLRAPDRIWVDSVEAIEGGRLLVLEHRSSFARVEVYGGPAALASDAWSGLQRELDRMNDYVARVGDPVDGLQRIEVRQGKERWIGVVRIVPRDGEYVAFVGLVPIRKWGAQRETVTAILRTATVVDAAGQR